MDVHNDVNYDLFHDGRSCLLHPGMVSMHIVDISNRHDFILGVIQWHAVTGRVHGSTCAHVSIVL